ncbi:MAG: tetratricopeptide repeat protein [Candidatus Marinimicrobia bacterium]|nr:tetratricopeptide repeat protein [Candidatus Neomarinimicrobiota bacterium]
MKNYKKINITFFWRKIFDLFLVKTFWLVVSVIIIFPRFEVLFASPSQSQSYEEQIQFLLEKSNQYFASDRDSAKYFAKKAVQKAQQHRDSLLLGKALYDQAYLFYRWGEMDTVKIYLESSLKIRRQIQDSTGMGRTMNLLGNAHWLLDDQYKARQYFGQALKINSQLNNHIDIGKSYNNLGNLFSRVGEYQKAIDYFLKARDHYQKADYQEGQAWLNFSLTLLYKRLGDYDKALGSIQKSLQVYQKISQANGDSTGIMLCYNQLGDIYRLRGEPEKGMGYSLKTLVMRRKRGPQSSIADALTGVGKCYYDLQQYDKAEKFMRKALNIRQTSETPSGSETNLKYLGYIASARGDQESALEYLKESLILAENRNMPITQSEILKKMAQIGADRKNYKKARQLYKRHIAIQDSLFSQKVSRRVASLQLQHKIDQQNVESKKLIRENKIHQLKLERARNWQYLMISLAVLFVLIIVLTIYLYKKKLHIKTLKGLIPICSNCKKIRNDAGYYEQVEEYIAKHSDMKFNPALCPDCKAKIESAEDN